WAETEGLPPLERMLELDRRIWLPDDLLMKADKMTMATSQELRVPFLDHRLIEWAAGLPARAKLRSSVGKWLLREAARERLPAECTAPGKRGFTVPVANWFRRQLHGPVRDALLSADSIARARFGEKAVRRLLDEHLRGSTDRKEELYALWVLELWRKRFEVGVGRAPAPVVQIAQRKAGTGMGALQGRDIVCFSNDWDGDPLSKMHAMRILARQNRVLWVNSIGNRRPTATARDVKRMLKKLSGAMQGLRERHPNIWVLTPLAIPFYGTELVRADKARVNSNAHLVQHGVDLEHFAKAFSAATTIPDDLKGAPGPIIGFWGLIADWVDLPLIRHVADAFSGGTVVLLGDTKTNTKPLDGARNIRVLGRKPYADLPRYAKAFDVALMPFKVNELTLA